MKNCTKIATNLEYIWKIFSIKYEFNVKDIIKPKNLITKL